MSTTPAPHPASPRPRRGGALRLAFCLFRYFPYGGLQRDMMAVANAATARGHQVVIYCSSWQGKRPTTARVTELPVRGWSNPRRMDKFLRLVRRAWKQESPDLKLGFVKMPGLDLYFAADPCFAHKAFHERGLLYRLTPRCRRYLGWEKAVFGASGETKILQLSATEQARYIEHYGLARERFHLLPPGINPECRVAGNTREMRRACRRELGLPLEQPILLMVASSFRTKGLDRALGALALLQQPNTMLLVAGADQPQPFVRLAQRLGVARQLRFLGGRDDVPRLLAAADVLVHPAYRENTGTVLLEAILAGLPVVTTDVCGYAHYVRQANMGCVLAAPYHDKALATALATLLHSPRGQWQQRGRAFAAATDVFSMRSQAVDIIEQLWMRKGADNPAG